MGIVFLSAWIYRRGVQLFTSAWHQPGRYYLWFRAGTYHGLVRGIFSGWQRIGMYRDKQVGIGAVSNVGTLFQRNKDIRLAGIDDSHILTFAVLEYCLISYGSYLDDSAIARRVDGKTPIFSTHSPLDEC